VDGDRAYSLARNNQPVVLQPVDVTVRELDILEWNGAHLHLRLVCSAGFYVRSLAQAIGECLRTGAHLANLVRTRSGDFSIQSAVSMADLDRSPETAAAQVIRLEQLLPHLPALTMTIEGAMLAARGGFLNGWAFVGRPAAADGGQGAAVPPGRPSRGYRQAAPHGSQVLSRFASWRRTGIKYLVWH